MYSPVNNTFYDTPVYASHNLTPGATIDEDKGLLQSTQNPILQELRKEKKDCSNRQELEDKLETLRQQCRELRKQK